MSWQVSELGESIMRTLHLNIDPFGAEELHALLAHHDEPCVSIYLPSQGVGAEIQLVPLRLAQLLELAETELTALGYRLHQAQAILKPARALLAGARAPFWQHQSDGLALFLAPNLCKRYWLPLPFAEAVVAGKRFYVRPLVPLLSGDGRFYVLALSQNQVKLFQGSRYTLAEISLRHAPHSLAESLRYDEFETHVQPHSAAGGGLGRGGRAVMFHGHGSAGDEATTKEQLVRFLHEVDNDVCAVLAEQTAPLVVAGVDTIQGLYHKVCHYPALDEQGIDGSPDRLGAKELHARAWTLAASGFRQPIRTAMEKFHRLHGQQDPRALCDLKQVLASAYQHRVETLFVASEGQAWGAFDPTTNGVELHEEAQPGDEELFDTAVVYTLQGSGAVYMLGDNEMPAGQPIAANLRF
jgi:hypothetical protein